MISEFRVEKTKADAVITLSDGVAVRGRFFVVASTANDWGPERIKDLLNAEPGFFPFEVGDAGHSRTVLFNRRHVVMVTLAGHEEPARDPGTKTPRPARSTCCSPTVRASPAPSSCTSRKAAIVSATTRGAAKPFAISKRPAKPSSST